jgi:hypothetical protein
VPRDSEIATSSSGTATTATGTFSQKIACQLTPSTTAPPMTGPSATPRPLTPPQMPIAAARIAGGTADASRVRESGMIAAAPRPWTARAAIRASEEVLSAEAIDARVKTAMPTSIIRRRPSRSPSVAAGSMKVAKVRV